MIGSRDDSLSSPLDPSQIELLLSLDDGDGMVLAEIISEYLNQTAQGRAELIRVVGQGDHDAMARTAHTLCGASANVGANRLAAVCAEIEARGRARTDGGAELVERFDAEFARVRAALHQATSQT